MHVSRLSSKCQITIPKSVRKKLDLTPGDYVGYESREDGLIVLRRVEPIDAAYYRSLSETLGEWHSAEDDDAFREL